MSISRRFASLVLCCCFFLVIPLLSRPALAAKKRVWRSNSGGGETYSTGKLSRPTNSVIITFLHLETVDSATYTLEYKTNKTTQGIVGTVTPAGQDTESRDLYFGTCSHGVCTPHDNISAATLTVETRLKTGVTNTKRYYIRI
ncbi:hypothetical protein M1555_03580 [Patescibacteria group bacterium]|nr:hypothetical protein [Patescibacteria group bacterium]